MFSMKLRKALNKEMVSKVYSFMIWRIAKMEQSKEMVRFLNELNQSYGDILTLRYYYDLTISEVANMLNIRK